MIALASVMLRAAAAEADAAPTLQWAGARAKVATTRLVWPD